MARIRLAALTLLPLVAFLWTPRAQAIGVGVEGGGIATFAGGNTAGSGNFGIIVENKFDITVLFLDLWADVQTPMTLQTGDTTSAQYVPIDLGLRLGLALGPIQPYIGALGQMAINTNSGSGPDVSSPLWGLGGDIGLDIALFFLRLGVEVRAVDLTTPVTADGSVSGYELEGLASVRLSF